MTPKPPDDLCVNGTTLERPIDLDEYERQGLGGEMSVRQIVALIEEARVLRELVRRAIKYAREDRMVTPGFTRLRRVLDEMERFADDSVREEATP